MPRKKVVKNAARKKQPSKQATKNPANLLQKIENDFAEAPARIAEQLSKEITALKQKESKLNTTIAKIQTQVSKIEKSIAAAKNASTAAGRKQLAAAKKVLNDTKKDHSISIAALKDTVKSLADAEIRLARIYALAKHLKQFDKDWAKQAKKLKDKEKAKAATKKKVKVAAKSRAKIKAAPQPIERIQPPTLTVIEQPDFDSSVEESEFDDAKQALNN